MISINNICKITFSGLISNMFVFILLISSLARAEEYRAKLTPEETKSIWLKSCGLSLFEAQSRYGSKITFPSKRDRQSFIDDVCNKAASDQLKHFAKKKSLSPESHACMYVAERGDLIVGFENHGQNSMTFAFGYCNNL